MKENVKNENKNKRLLPFLTWFGIKSRGKKKGMKIIFIYLFEQKSKRKEN